MEKLRCPQRGDSLPNTEFCCSALFYLCAFCSDVDTNVGPGERSRCTLVLILTAGACVPRDHGCLCAAGSQIENFTEVEGAGVRLKQFVRAH